MEDKKQNPETVVPTTRYSKLLAIHNALKKIKAGGK
jgi:hypothetical protein